MRIIALLAAYNEERFIGPCLENLIRQGLEVYLIDNSSVDSTVSIAEKYLGRGLLHIEIFPRDGMFCWQSLLKRKEELAATLDADWFLHVDADEIRLPPISNTSIAEALVDIDTQGYNTVNFFEFTFIPTREEPDHDHPQFQQTMCWYYPFLPSWPHRLNMWKRQDFQVDLASSGGHKINFPDLRIYPHSFPMRHYLFLSVAHAEEKYINKEYDPEEIASGWHRSRIELKSKKIRLPSQKLLRYYKSDDCLDSSSPLICHYLFDADWAKGDKKKLT